MSEVCTGGSIEKEMTDLGKYGGVSVGDPDRLDVGDEDDAIKDGAQVWAQAVGCVVGLFTELWIMGRARPDGERRSEMKSSDLGI